MVLLICGHQSNEPPLDWAPEGRKPDLTYYCSVCDSQRRPRLFPEESGE